MTYVDTDFFMALFKPQDWLKAGAKRLLRNYMGQLRTSSAALIEILFLAEELGVDPRILVMDVIAIAPLKAEDATPYLKAAFYVSHYGANVADALHAAFAGTDAIISSDKVYDRIGLKRIPLDKS